MGRGRLSGIYEAWGQQHSEVVLRGVEALHGELAAKNRRYMRPGLETTPWGTVEFGVIDPFGNSIVFCERRPEPAGR